MNPHRITLLKDGPSEGGYVLYWMQQNQRVDWNFAIQYAIEKANEKGIPLLVLFVMTPFAQANWRHYEFMLQGIREVARKLAEKQISFCFRIGDPLEIVTELAKNANLLVFDQGYLRSPRLWRKDILQRVQNRVVEIEDSLVVPVESASSKQEWSAYTLRRKITPMIEKFLEKEFNLPLLQNSQKIECQSTSIPSSDALRTWLSENSMDTQTTPVKQRGGHEAAFSLLEDFLSQKIDKYHSHRNDPANDFQSHLSAYLHFGQISPQEILNYLSDSQGEGKVAFLEELVVRRELAFNYCWYNWEYDSYNALPDWARKTLEKHASDPRPVVYSIEELEGAKTHDPYWNAAQMEMVHTGQMHGYMRMYWGKKILEWTSFPQDAFSTAIYLNNKYCLDGRDPNSFVGVGWCFGLHDRPWKERSVFGMIRYMAKSGLERKFDMEGYLIKVGKLLAT